MKIKELLQKKITFRVPDKHTALHHTHTAVHCTYLGAVFQGAHGMYAYAAGVLLIVIIIGLFIGEEL